VDLPTPTAEATEQQVFGHDMSLFGQHRSSRRIVTVKLNGVTIVDVSLDMPSQSKTLDGREYLSLKRLSGCICFCGHGSRVDSRNLRIKELIGPSDQKVTQRFLNRNVQGDGKRNMKRT
jgi:hypothetical protein